MVAPLLTTLIIRIGSLSIRTIKLAPKDMKVLINVLTGVLRKAGIKSKSIQIFATPGSKVIKVTGTRAELKAAAIAVGSAIATYTVIAKDIEKKIIPKKAAVHKRKYTLTRKQAAKLKKDGYVYITRNKKQIKVVK